MVYRPTATHFQIQSRDDEIVSRGATTDWRGLTLGQFSAALAFNFPCIGKSFSPSDTNFTLANTGFVSAKSWIEP
jgi:hypothetical protein